MIDHHEMSMIRRHYIRFAMTAIVWICITLVGVPVSVADSVFTVVGIPDTQYEVAAVAHHGDVTNDSQARQFQMDGDDRMALNGMALYSLPEPSSYVLMMTAFIGLLWRKRK